jgi:pilus assembly protein TadC
MLYRLMPKGYRSKIETLLRYSGSRKKPSSFVGYSFVCSLGAALLLGTLFRQYFLFVFALSFVSALGMLHLFLYVAVDRRTRFVEKILPDALQLVAANIKSGFIPSRALMLSARSEFGPLADAIKNVGKETMTGKPLFESLGELTKTIKSDILEITVTLVGRGIRSGGQLVSLFEETAVDIRRREGIKREVKANIVMYGIFITFAGCIGAPALYALSGFLVTTISRIGGMTNIPEDVASRLPMKVGLGGVGVSPEFLMLFSVAAIVITTIFGGLILGLISTGKESSGAKYIPVLLIISLSIYFVAGMVVRNLFGNIMPG